MEDSVPTKPYWSNKCIGRFRNRMIWEQQSFSIIDVDFMHFHTCLANLWPHLSILYPRMNSLLRPRCVKLKCKHSNWTITLEYVIYQYELPRMRECRLANSRVQFSVHANIPSVDERAVARRSCSFCETHQYVYFNIYFLCEYVYESTRSPVSRCLARTNLGCNIPEMP